MQKRWLYLSLITVFSVLCFSQTSKKAQPEDWSTAAELEATNPDIGVTVQESDGSYRLFARHNKAEVSARVAAKIDQKWVRANEYPKHTGAFTLFKDEAGGGRQLTVTNTGLAGVPDLVYIVRLHLRPLYGEIEVQVHNTTAKPVTVQAIRMLETTGDPAVNLDGLDSADRVLDLSDAAASIETARELKQASDGTFGSGRGLLIINTDSKLGVVLGARSAGQWKTSLQLHIQSGGWSKVSGCEADSVASGVNAAGNSVAPSASISSEPLVLSIGADSARQLAVFRSVIPGEGPTATPSNR